MSRPRVLFLTTSYPSDEAPATGAFVLEHARAAAMQADVAVLHLDRRHDARAVSVHRDTDGELPTWRARYPYRPAALSMLGHICAGLAGYRAVRKAGFDPDLLHAHFFLSALPGALLSAATGKRLLETEQWTIFLPEDPNPLTLPLRIGARVSLHRARLIMPVSESLARAMQAAGIRGTFRVVPNAVDISLFKPGPTSDGCRLVTVGLLQYQKGVDMLLQAFAEVRTAHPEATLEVVGDGPERSAYEALSSELGLDGAVHFHGILPKTEIAAILGTAHVFVLASRFDNNPCVLVEAQAAGLPIVATRVGGIPEIVTGYGLLAERDDVGGLAARISEALVGLGAYDRNAIAAHARERYSLEQVGEQLADAYRSVLDGR